MNRQEKLEWLARELKEWKPAHDLCVVEMDHGGAVYVRWPIFCSVSDCTFDEQEWLSMREKLQNKPKFADHPDAKCFVQDNAGHWFKNVATDSPTAGDHFWNVNPEFYSYKHSGFELACKGEILGDWRDTLEKRPEPVTINNQTASTVTATKTGQNEMTITTQDSKKTPPKEDIDDVIERIYWELDDERSKKLNPERDIFKRKVRHAIYMSSEIDKQTKYEKPQDNSWHERGELPPVGCKCLYVVSERLSYEVEITAHARFGLVFVEEGTAKEVYVVKSAEQRRFRPLRTEREKAIEKAVDCVGYLRGIANVKLAIEKLYDAGILK